MQPQPIEPASEKYFPLIAVQCKARKCFQISKQILHDKVPRQLLKLHLKQMFNARIAIKKCIKHFCVYIITYIIKLLFIYRHDNTQQSSDVSSIPPANKISNQ